MTRIAFAIALAITASPSLAAEKSLRIPTDAKASYTILETEGTWPNRTIVTKRVGSSGTTYSKRLYNCSNSTVKYLGTGDSLAEMARSKADPKMASIVDQSIADYVGRQACKR
jgi:hypothetical protein